jgi:hypothetical protein
MIDLDDEEWPDDWMEENTEVFLALRNAREQPTQIIAAFLRSNTPIHPLLRTALADAFEGVGPDGSVRFEVQGVPYGPFTPGGRRRLQRDMSIAEFVADRRSQGAKRSEAEREAAAHFSIGEDHCHKAVTQVGKMHKWLDENMPLTPPDHWSPPADVWRALCYDTYLLHLSKRQA